MRAIKIPWMRSREPRNPENPSLRPELEKNQLDSDFWKEVGRQKKEEKEVRQSCRLELKQPSEGLGRETTNR